MKPFRLSITGVALIVMALFGFKRSQPVEVAVADPASSHLVKPAANSGFALVELFTSEGCSSCPPADALANRLVASGRQQLFVLSFHVDYWNRLGWKDPFSKADWSARQQAYARYLNTNGAYTPQAVVNGSVELVGSDQSRLNNAINKGLSQPAGNNIVLKATLQDKTIQVQYQTASEPGSVLNIALVQKRASSSVQKGENEGLQLQHSNIVLQLKEVPASAVQQHVTLPVPDGLSASDLMLIGYTQQRETWHITGATSAAIPTF